MTMHRVFALVGAAAVVGFGAGVARQAGGAEKAAGAGGASGSAVPTNCKQYGGKGRCCDPAVMAHLAKDAVYKACGESDATYLGESGAADTCRYTFKIEGEKPEETFVEVYAPAQKDVPPQPTDPFFAWKKVGKVYVTEKAKSPKSMPMIAAGTGLWLPGKGYIVSVNASTKVCTKAEAKRLASSMK